MGTQARSGALPRWTFYLWLVSMAIFFVWIATQSGDGGWQWSDLAVWGQPDTIVVDGIEYEVVGDEGDCDALSERASSFAERLSRDDIPSVSMDLYDAQAQDCVSAIGYDAAENIFIEIVIDARRVER